MTARVVVTDWLFPDLAREREAATAAGAEFAAHQCRSDAEVAAVVEDAAVVAVQFARFGARSAAAVRPGASILRYGVGYDNLDLAAAAAAGLRLGYVPDYCTSEVADHAATAILALLRKLGPLDRSVRAGEWSPVERARPILPFARTRVGFFGFGRIGRQVQARLRPFGFRFLATDPALTGAEAAELEVQPVDFATLLAESHVLSLHAAAAAGADGLLDAAAFRRMRRGAFLVNTARGQLVREADLVEALDRGIIAGAALDVFPEEPLPADSPLRRAENVILTPHVAWYSDAAMDRLQALVAEDITRALRGEAPRRPVPGGHAGPGQGQGQG